jgi:hypothetical protein
MKAPFRLYGLTLLPLTSVISSRFINFDVSGGQVLCPLRLCTGLQCPTCGSTRSIFALFSGRTLEAIKFNPALIAIICAFTLAKIYQLRFFGNWTFPENNASYTWPNLREDRAPFVIVLLLLFAWTILRNL